MSQGQNYYWNLTASDFTSILNLAAWFSVWGFFQDHSSHDLYFFELGKSASDGAQQQARELHSALTSHYDRVSRLRVH